MHFENVSSWLVGRNMQSLFRLLFPRPTEVEQALQASHSAHSDGQSSFIIWVILNETEIQKTKSEWDEGTHFSWVNWKGTKTHQNNLFCIPFPVFLWLDCMLFPHSLVVCTPVLWSLFRTSPHRDIAGLGLSCKESMGSKDPILRSVGNSPNNIMIHLRHSSLLLKK